jgi:DNA adenine methylase
VPFLKWAGGKRWLTSYYPDLFPHTFGRYVEPFLGGGAVFFHLKPKVSVLSDFNVNLVHTYDQVRENWKLIEQCLKRHQRNHSPRYYYEERARKHRASHERAAQFIYLNRVCWNGLYRVNLRGEFNVPIGTKTSVLLDTDNFEYVAKLLEGARLVASDFEPMLDATHQGDFVFIDPPYVTRHNFNGFAKYNDKIFSWADQERLSVAIARAAKRGAQILITNANHASVKYLYREIGQNRTLKRHSVLAADASNRSKTTEVAISINYDIS